jgi:hypothetical protein
LCIFAGFLVKRSQLMTLAISATSARVAFDMYLAAGLRAKEKRKRKQSSRRDDDVCSQKLLAELCEAH